MELEIRFACKSEEEELRDIMLSFSMDLAGDIEEHVILKEGETICAGAKLSLLDRNAFHLEVLGVRDDRRGTGAGRLLLSKLLQDPWNYCHGEPLDPDENYRVTVVSKGDAAPFYEKLGFERCSFSDLDSPYDEQCDTCPDAEKCHPVPMALMGGGRLCSTQSLYLPKFLKQEK